MKQTLYITISICIFLTTAQPAHSEDWPQAAANAARTAHVSDQPEGPIETIWVKRWGDEVMHNTNQPIIVGGVVYLGTANAVVHAVDAATGKDLWKVKVGGPLIHALASDGERIFAAAMDGTVYALAADSGSQVWSSKLSRRGFCAALLLMEDNLYCGNRDGVMYAVSSKSGRKLWERNTGAPIEHTAAGAQGRVVFVDKAMTVWCLDADSGDVVWKAEDIPGSSVRDYWPVIHKGKVIIRTREGATRELSGHMSELQRSLFFPASYGAINPQLIKFKAKTIDDILKEQQWFVSYFEKNPKAHTFAVLNLSDGTEPYKASVVAGCCNTGAIPPPALAGDGRLYTPFPTSAAHRGIINITRLGVGHFNIETGRIDKPLLCAGGDGVSDVIGVRTPFEVTSDETVCLSSGGDILFGIRGDMDPGGINVISRERVRISVPPRPRAQDMQPGGNVVAVSGRYLAYVKNSEVICLAAKSYKAKNNN